MAFRLSYHTAPTDRGFASLFLLVSATLALEFIKKHHESAGGDVAEVKGAEEETIAVIEEEKVVEDVEGKEEAEADVPEVGAKTAQNDQKPVYHTHQNANTNTPIP